MVGSLISVVFYQFYLERYRAKKIKEELGEEKYLMYLAKKKAVHMQRIKYGFFKFYIGELRGEGCIASQI